jgi:hypothetical protein
MTTLTLVELHLVGSSRGQPNKYTLRVCYVDGIGRQGCTITLGGLTQVTDVNGYYFFESVPNGTYTLSAAKTGYSYDRIPQTIVVASINQTALLIRTV